MILSTNAFNWAALRSGLSTPDFIATLTHEREVELFKAYNEWRKDKGLPEETMPAPSPTPVALSSNKKSEEDVLTALITEVAAEVEAEEVALIQDALDGADKIVEENESVPADIVKEIEEEETEPTPEEVEKEEEIEADQPVSDEEKIGADESGPEAEEAAEPVPTASEVAITPAVPDDDRAERGVMHEAGAAVAAQSVDFATIVRSLPKIPDPALYSSIVERFGEETKGMAKAALKEATAKHRTTAAIRAFIAWLEQE